VERARSFFEYHKRAASFLAGEAVTVTFNSTLSYSQVVAFGVNGANATPYDPNASLPDGTVIGVGGTASASTTNAGSMALAAIRINTGSATLDSGFSQIWSSNFFMVEYKPMNQCLRLAHSLLMTPDQADQMA
jgi:hypothetical protein